MSSIFIAPSTFSVNSKEPLEILENIGLELIVNKHKRKLETEELLNLAKNAKGIIAGTEMYSKFVLEKLKYLRVISRLGVGLDNIDLEFAEKKGIRIIGTTTNPAQAVAELALGLILDISRKITKHNMSLKAYSWNKEMGNLLQGKTLGIIGLGNIGKALVKLVRGFNFNIIVFDMHHDNSFAKENNINYCDLETLLSKSDIVSIHLNLTPQTRGMINKKRIKKMNSESILINTSRGEIIDELTLYTALKEKQISGAGLDVFFQEPYSGPLTKLKNVVLTPHIGAYAKEIRVQMEIEAAHNLIKELK